MSDVCAVLFSGGTDSLCAAALACEKHSHVHLLTFYERATENSTEPKTNVQRLRDRYPNVKIEYSRISTDNFVQKLSYHEYFKSLVKFKFLNLATPGISSLSWHCAAIKYSKKNRIKIVYDGMTRELLHLPGHMPEIRSLFISLYGEYGISFSSPVIDWQVPPDQRFIDRLIIDRHGFTLTAKPNERTTGQWLYEKKILPHPNVKGSLFDQRMQHDCYPFVVYNMLVFWIYQPLYGFEKYKLMLGEFFSYKINLAKEIILNAE